MLCLTLLSDALTVDAVVITPDCSVYALVGDREPQLFCDGLKPLQGEQTMLDGLRLDPVGLDPNNISAHLSVQLCDEPSLKPFDLAWIHKDEALSFSPFGWPRRHALVRRGEMGNLARHEPEGWYNAQAEAYGSLVFGDYDYLHSQDRDWTTGRRRRLVSPLGPRLRLSPLAV